MGVARVFCVYALFLFVLISFSSLFVSPFISATTLGQPYHPAAGEFSEITVYDATHRLNPLVDRVLQNNDAVLSVVVAADPVIPADLTFANIGFQSCQSQGNGKSLCTLSLPPSLCSGNLNYRAANFQLNYIIDGTNPSLGGISLVSSVTTVSPSTGEYIPVISPGNVSLSYTNVRDFPDLSGGDCGSCAGIKKVILYQGPPNQNKKIGEVSFSLTVEELLADACAIPDATIGVPLAVNVQGEEETTLYAVACDTLDHCSKNIVSTRVMIDNRAPAIESKLFDGFGQETGFYQEGAPFIIEAKIRDRAGFNPDTLVLDIAQFSPGQQPTPEIKGEIVRWKFVALATTEPTTYTITVEDGVGNRASHTQYVSLGKDSAPPQITLLRTDRVFEGISYIGATTPVAGNSQSTTATIIAEISDDASGVNPSTVVFDLRELGLSSDERADGCERSGAHLWRCEKRISHSFTEGIFTISVAAKDLVGNIAPETKAAKVVVDLTPPKNVAIKATMDFPTPQDVGIFGYAVKATDNSPLEIYSSFSSISSGGNVTAHCKVEKPCIIYPRNLRALSGTFPIDIVVRDVAGNIAPPMQLNTPLLQVQSCTPQTITLSLQDPQPPLVDKRVASKIPAEIIFPIVVDGQNSNVKVGDFAVHNCDSLGGAFKITASRIVGGGSSALLIIELQTKAGPGSEIERVPLSCQLSASLALNNKKCATPVVQNVSAEITLTGSPIGDISSTGKDKLAAVQTKINSLDGKIKSYEKRMHYLNLWCNIAETANSISTAMSGTLAIVQPLACAITFIPVVGTAVGEALYTGTCVPTQITTQITDYVLWSKSYLPYPPKTVGVLSKYACIIRKCALCNLNEVFQIAGGIATEVAARKEYSSDELGKEVAHVGGGSSRVSFKSYVTPQDKFAAKEATAYANDLKLTVAGKKDLSADILWGGVSSVGKATEMSATAPGANDWTWDPYKSIHYARACFCYNGIIFNMKKEKDIYCLYRDCLQETLSKGLPTTVCEIDKQIQQCLYIDSAQYKKYGFVLWDNLFDALVRYLKYYFIMLGFDATCGWTYGKPVDCYAACGGWYKMACNVAGVALSIGELDLLNGLGDKFDISSFGSSSDPRALQYVSKC